MPLKITYKNLKDPMFIQTVAKVAGHPMRAASARNATVLIRGIEKEQLLARETWLKTLKQYAKLDEKGEFIPKDGQAGTYEVPPEKEEDCKKALEEFDNIEFEIEAKKIPLQDLSKLEISPAQFNVIDFLIGE